MLRSRYSRVLAEMKVHTFRHLSAVYEVVDPMTYGRMRGSATVLAVHGTPYLLTAKHVIESFSPTSFGGYRSRNGAPPLPLPNIIHALPRPLDLAAIELVPEHLHTSDIVPLSPSRLEPRTPDLEGDLLFIHGLPGVLSRFTAFGPALVSESCPYLTVSGTSTYPWFDERLHLAIEYPADGQENELGEPVALPDPHGLSGSLIWKTNYASRQERWTAEDATVVGLVHTWDQGAQSLIGTRVEFVRVLLLHAARRRDAFLRWEARGRPSADDWTDWFEAEHMLPSLEG